MRNNTQPAISVLANVDFHQVPCPLVLLFPLLWPSMARTT